MKPLLVQIVYNNETKEKAFEIYNSVKKYYRLYHEYKNAIITPMFEINITCEGQSARRIPDIILLPDNFSYIEGYNKPYELKIIRYNQNEDIKLWEQY